MKYSTFLVLLLPVCVLTACYSICKTCVNPNSSSGRYRCTSCYTNYALDDQSCYSCGYCTYYDLCDDCEISTTGSSSSSSQTIGIMFGLLGGIILVCIIIIFIYCKCRVMALNQRVQLANHSANNILLDNQSVKWTKTDKIINPNQNCAICLQNNVNVLTKCNHLYHPRCIWEWCNRREVSCPLCKGTDLQNMRYYCSKCTMNYVEVPISYFPTMAADVKYANCGKCNE